jgi:hypothetical protein
MSFLRVLLILCCGSYRIQYVESKFKSYGYRNKYIFFECIRTRVESEIRGKHGSVRKRVLGFPNHARTGHHRHCAPKMKWTMKDELIVGAREKDERDASMIIIYQSLSLGVFFRSGTS